MRTRLPVRIFTTVLCFGLGIALFGCGAVQKRPLSLRTPAPVKRSPMETTPQVTPTPMAQSEMIPTDRQQIVQLQDNLSKEARSVPGVSKAWVVLSGSVAMVGAEMNGNTLGGTKQDTAGIKNEIMARLRRVEPRLTSVVVATDTGTANQVRQVAEKMRSGKQNTTLARDINKISQKLMPSVR